MEPFSGLGCLPFSSTPGGEVYRACGSGRHAQELSSHLSAPGVAALGKEGWSLTHPVFAPDCKCPAWRSTTCMALGSLGSGWVLPLKLCMSLLFQKPPQQAVLSPPLGLLLSSGTQPCMDTRFVGCSPPTHGPSPADSTQWVHNTSWLADCVMHSSRTPPFSDLSKY